MKDKEIIEIKELIGHATFVFVSKESSRKDLLEIIESQIGWWEELEDYLNSCSKPKTNDK